MKSFRLVVPVMAIVIAMASAVELASAAEAMAVGQMAEMASKAAGAKAKRDLLSMLQPDGVVIDRDEAGSRDIRLSSKPEGAGWAGLCQREELFVSYNAPGAGRIEKRIVQPVGFGGRRTYHVIKAPVRDLRGTTSAARLQWSDKCGRLGDDSSARWFFDNDPVEAAKVANTVQAVAQAVQTGRLKPESCELRLSGKSCAQAIIEGGRALQIVGVARNCTPGAGQECYVVDLAIDLQNTVRLTVVAEFEDESLIPKNIAHVSADGPLFYPLGQPPG